MSPNFNENSLNKGGNDPRRLAVLGKLRTLSQQGSGTPTAGAGPIPTAGVVPPQVRNEFAVKLADAFEAFMRTGPTDENMAALVQFISTLQEVAAPPESQTAPGQAQAPLGPQAPSANATPPLPAVPQNPTPGAGARGGPLMPPR